MTENSTIIELPRISKLQDSKLFALWRLYVKELMRRVGVLCVVSHDLPDAEVSTMAVKNKFRKNNEKARPHIALNVRVEPATLIASLVLSR